MPVDASPAPLPGAVLFACNFNQVRSPMAEALLKRLVGTSIFVDSCGLRYPPFDPEVETGIDPFVEAVMSEIGCDLSRHRVKTFEELTDGSFDLIVSLTPECEARAVEMARRRSADVEYWPIPDPTLADGSREARLAAYREVREDLARRIAARFRD
jgi:protein-tyrosine-phosphatase